MNGAYFQFGDLRKTSLELAIESASLFGGDYALATDAVVSRAESYFEFLTTERVWGNPKIPS